MSDTAQVEVVATVKESAREAPTLKEGSTDEISSYRQVGQLNLEVLDLRKLDPDVNGDGKISASEKLIYGLLKAADVGRGTAGSSNARATAAHEVRPGRRSRY